MNISRALVANRSASIFQNTIFKLLSGLQHGSLRIIDDAEYTFGNPRDSLHATIHINSKRFYQSVFINGGVGFAESYINNEWQCDDLTKVLQILAKNMHLAKRSNRLHTVLFFIFTRAAMFAYRNTIGKARKNIAAHYDLRNDFFKLFLDTKMMYSCAQFNQTSDLEVAAEYKLQNICERLEIKTTDHVLEIGGGWGGFAIYAATHYGCRVTTTTISQEQYKHVVERVLAHGLKDRVTVICKDYRDLSGKFDKLVSIEMIEAVGHQYFKQYFSKCSELLKDNGLFMLQAITIRDQNYTLAKNEVDFIKKYIFPGGCLPSVATIMHNVAQDTDLALTNLENISLDYAKTLRAWRTRFDKQKAQILKMGFDTLFIKKWLYYFCICEAGFLEANIGTYQLLLSKPMYRSQSYTGYAATC